MSMVFGSAKNFITRHQELLLVLLIAAVFRFFRYSDLQFWSTDEELIAHFGRKIVEEHKIFLISPNFTISSSLGSSFHMLTGLMYWISDMLPDRVFLLGTLLSLLTTALIYYVGNAVKNKAVGVIASVLYAGSLLMSLNDRRWWTLTTAPFFTTLALYALVNIHKKKVWHAILLAISIISSWQVDPNMAIIPVATFLSVLIFKIKFTRQQLVAMGSILLLSIAPLVVFELRHPGTIVQPVLHHLAMKKDASETKPFRLAESLLRFPTIYGQYLFAQATPTMDASFNWVTEVEPLFSPLLNMVIINILLFVLFKLFTSRNHDRTFDALRIVVLFWIIATISLLLFTAVFHRSVQTHYFHVAVPIIYILLAYGLYELTKQSKYVLIALMGFYVGINTLMLTSVRFEFPLRDKQMLVDTIIDSLDGRQFSLYTIPGKHLVNTGFTGLFVLRGISPIRSTDYMALDWWYRTQSLYFVNPSTQDSDRVVLIGQKGFMPVVDKYQLFTTEIGSMEAVIVDNTTGWFDLQQLVYPNTH